MGFWDLNIFNLAMLAKQTWCFIQGTHSLFYQVYKARYFPTCSYMEAKLGSNPLYVWRSLLQAKELLREGSAWRIGDGETEGIASHKWLPQPPIFRLEANQSLKVSSFLTRALASGIELFSIPCSLPLQEMQSLGSNWATQEDETSCAGWRLSVETSLSNLHIMLQLEWPSLPMVNIP